MAGAKKKRSRRATSGQRSAKKGNKKATGGNIGDRPRRFCELVAAGKNGTEAATEAGYAPRSARSRAAKLLARPDIQVKVKDLTKAATAKALDTPLGKDIVARASEAAEHTDETAMLAMEIQQKLIEMGSNGPVVDGRTVAWGARAVPIHVTNHSSYRLALLVADLGS